MSETGDVFTQQGVIGSGGRAYVFRGENKLTGQPVAIKLFTEATADTEDSPEREMRTHAELNRTGSHPNIIPLVGYDFTHSQGRPFLITDLASGGSLLSRIPRGEGMLLEEALDPLLGAAAGLHELHRRNRAHRDIKPGNIVIGGNGEGVLIDFGLTRPISSDRIQTPSAGTPRFAPPEQLKGQGGTRSGDAYSYAVTVFFALTGQNPFGELSGAEYIEPKEKGEFMVFQDLKGGSPRNVVIGNVLAEGMDPNPRRRPGVRTIAHRLQQASRISDNRNAVVIA